MKPFTLALSITLILLPIAGKATETTYLNRECLANDHTPEYCDKEKRN